MYRMTLMNVTLLDCRDKDLIISNARVKNESNTVGEGSFTIYENHPNYGFLEIGMLRPVFEVSDEHGVVFRGRMTEYTRNIHKGKAVDLEGVMAYFNDSVVRPYTFPDDWEKEDHPDHASYVAAAQSGNVVEYYLAWLIAQHNAQVQTYQQFKLGNVTVADSSNKIKRFSTGYPKTWEELSDKLFKSTLGGHLCIRYEDDGNYIDYLAKFTEKNTQGITYGENVRDFSESADASETYSAILPLGKTITIQRETGEDYEGDYGTIVGTETIEKRVSIDELNDGDITDDIVKSGDTLYSRSAVANYGWRYAPITETMWEDVEEPENLLRNGLNYLAGKITKIPNTIQVTAVDLHCTDAEIRSFRINKKIPVYLKPFGINEDFDLTALDIDLLNPQNTKITVGKTVMTFTDYQAQQNSNLNAILGSIVTKEQLETSSKTTETLIEKSQESILLKVSETCATKADLNNYVTYQASIEVFNQLIDISVKGTYATKGELEEVEGRLALEILEAADGSHYSRLSADVDRIEFNTGQIIINSTDFTLDSTGRIVANSGKIGDWNIDGGSLVGYNEYNNLSVKLTPTGINLYNGTAFIRLTSGGIHDFSNGSYQTNYVPWSKIFESLGS